MVDGNLAPAKTKQRAQYLLKAYLPIFHHIFQNRIVLKNIQKTSVLKALSQLSTKCLPELKRTIIAQGESVNLSPAVVSSCAEDLVTYCAGYEKDKDDWGCLQVGMLWNVVL